MLHLKIISKIFYDFEKTGDDEEEGSNVGQGSDVDREGETEEERENRRLSPSNIRR